MKKITALVLTFVLVLALTACGGNSVPQEKLDSVVEKHNEIVALYDENAEIVATLGDEAIAEYENLGKSIDEMADAINENLSSLSEDEVDTLIAQLDSGIAALENIGGELSDAADALPNLDFTIINNTGADFVEINVSASDVEEWEENLLTETLLDGEALEVTFPTGVTTTLWDLRAADENGDSLYWTGLDLSKISEVTLNWDGENATAEVK